MAFTNTFDNQEFNLKILEKPILFPDSSVYSGKCLKLDKLMSNQKINEQSAQTSMKITNEFLNIQNPLPSSNCKAKTKSYANVNNTKDRMEKVLNQLNIPVSTNPESKYYKLVNNYYNIFLKQEIGKQLSIDRSNQTNAMTTEVELPHNTDTKLGRHQIKKCVCGGVRSIPESMDINELNEELKGVGNHSDGNNQLLALLKEKNKKLKELNKKLTETTTKLEAYEYYYTISLKENKKLLYQKIKQISNETPLITTVHSNHHSKTNSITSFNHLSSTKVDDPIQAAERESIINKIVSARVMSPIKLKNKQIEVSSKIKRNIKAKLIGDHKEDIKYNIQEFQKQVSSIPVEDIAGLNKLKKPKPHIFDNSNLALYYKLEEVIKRSKSILDNYSNLKSKG